MSTASRSLPIATRQAAPRRRRPAAEVGALARIEGRRLLVHPVFLIGLALSLWIVVAGTGSNGPAQALILSGFASMPLAAGALVAANLAALRSRRDGTDELYASLPYPRASRVAGQLVGLAWTLPVTGAVIAVAYIAFGAADGLVVNHLGVRHTPALVELAQGPLVVVAFGAIGILLARVAPSAIVGPLMVVALFAAEVPTAVWGSAQTPGAWLVPWSNDMLNQPGPWVPCAPGDTVPACSLVLGFDLVAMTWHLAYLAGLTALAAAGAVLSGRRRLLSVAALAGALVITTALTTG